MSDATFDSHLAQYIAQNTNSQTKTIIKEELEKLLNEFDNNARYQAVSKAMDRHRAAKQSFLRRLWQTVKAKFKELGESIPKRLKSIFMREGSKVAASTATTTGEIAAAEGATKATLRSKGMSIFRGIGQFLLRVLQMVGAAPFIIKAILVGVTAGAVIYLVMKLVDDGVGGVSGDALAGAGKDASEQTQELTKLKLKAFRKVKSKAWYDFGPDQADDTVVRRMRGKSDDEVFAALKRRLSREDYERAETLQKEIKRIQMNRRFEQAFGRLKKENPNLSTIEVGAAAGSVALGGPMDGGIGGKKPKPKPKPGGGGSKAAKQRALAKRLGMSIRDIQKELVNFFKKGSNTFSAVKEDKSAGLEPDGKYGSETEQAIKDFQNEFNGFIDTGAIKGVKKLTPDGLFGSLTRDAVKMVKDNKAVFAMSKLNPKNSNQGTMVAGGGAIGIPGGPKFGPIKPEDIPKYSLSQDATDRNATSTNGKVLELIAKVEGENAVFNLVDGGDYKKPVLATGKSKIINNLPNWLDAFKDLKKNAKPNIALRDSDVTPSLKPFTESKRGKTTMNKTKLINIIKEEIESILSEYSFRGGPSISRDTEEIARLPGKAEYYDKIRAQNLAFLNQARDPGRYKGYTLELPDTSYPDKPMDYEKALEYIKGTKKVPRDENTRESFWAAVKIKTGRLVIPDLVTGEPTGEKSVKGKVGQDRIAKQNLGKLPKDLPKQSSQALAQGIKGSVADPTVLAKIAKNKKRQRRLTSPNTLRKIQRKLIQLRFLPAKIRNSRQDDGSYGLNTMQAIEKFQTWANKYKPGLEVGEVDGIAGNKTRTALRSTNLEQVLTSQVAGKMRDAGEL